MDLCGEEARQLFGLTSISISSFGPIMFHFLLRLSGVSGAGLTCTTAQ